MTTLKTALACYAFLMIGLTWDFATGFIGVREYAAVALLMYALALIVASVVEFVALVLEEIKKRFFE